MGAQCLPPNPDILDQVVNCFDTAVNASDIPNQSQVTQSQSPTTNHLSAQAHLCSLQRLHWRSCATIRLGGDAVKFYLLELKCIHLSASWYGPGAGCQREEARGKSCVPVMMMMITV